MPTQCRQLLVLNRAIQVDHGKDKEGEVQTFSLWVDLLVSSGLCYPNNLSHHVESLDIPVILGVVM